MTTTVLWVLFLLIAAFLGSPLFTILGAIAMLAFSAQGTEISAVIIEMYRVAGTQALVAIPLFTFAGYMLAESNTPQRLVKLSRAVLGWAPGGLAVVTIFTTAIFTAFTGASGVTIVAVGGLFYPILIKEKYPEKFALGLMTTSGSLGMLFPPSLPIILYAVVAQVSIDKLFAAGLVPGTVLLVLLSIYGVRTGISSGTPRHAFEWKTAFQAIREAAWEIPLPLIILGGIYGGFFTATEAAAITAFYVFVVEVFIYRDLKLFSDVPRVMKESMLLVGAIIVILGSALGLMNYLIDQQVPQQIFELISQFVSSKILFLILLNIFLLIVGMMMDIFSAIVSVPLILPVAMHYNVDPVHLGIIFLANLEIGYLCPPFGLNLFISSFRFNRPVIDVIRSTMVFIGILMLALALITYIPHLSLWLVEAMGIQ